MKYYIENRIFNIDIILLYRIILNLHNKKYSWGSSWRKVAWRSQQSQLLKNRVWQALINETRV